MAWTVDVSRSVRQSFPRLPRHVQDWAAKVIANLHDSPRIPGAEKLTAKGKRFKVRKGEFRLVYEVRDSDQTVLVQLIGDRKDIYRDL